MMSAKLKVLRTYSDQKKRGERKIVIALKYDKTTSSKRRVVSPPLPPPDVFLQYTYRCRIGIKEASTDRSGGGLNSPHPYETTWGKKQGGADLK